MLLIGQSADAVKWPGRLKRAARALHLVAALLPVAGCSWSWQLGSFAPADPDITGSIKPRFASPLSPVLDEEDWRRARAALAVALDPQGNGKAVSWGNPDSGLKGSFTPVGTAFVQKDEICRAFLADLTAGSGQSWLQGSACRSNPDDWSVKDVKPWTKPD